MTRPLAAAIALSLAYGCTGNTGTLNLFPEVPTESGGAGGGSSCATGSCDTGGGGTGGDLAVHGGTRNAADASLQRPDAAPPETGGAGTCSTERDCRSGEASYCVASRCVECRDDHDCTSGDRHHCSDNRCVECRSDDDCTVGDKPGCVLSTGRCDDCSRDSQCEPGEHCSIDEGKCR
jgi:hypothetical protein